MKLHLYIPLLIGITIFDVANSITSTPTTTAAVSCRGVYLSDVLDVCLQGLFFISPEISTNNDDPTPVLYSELQTFTVIPGNLSCNYVVQWKTPHGTFDELDGHVEPGINQICAINEIYTACGYIFLISTTIKTTKTTVSTTSLTSTTMLPSSTKTSSSTSALTPTDTITTQALSTATILTSTEQGSSVPSSSWFSTVPDSSSSSTKKVSSSQSVRETTPTSPISMSSTTPALSSTLLTSSISSSITSSSSMESTSSTSPTSTSLTSAVTSTVVIEPTTTEASTATDSTITMSKTPLTSSSSFISQSTSIASSTSTSSVAPSTPSSSIVTTNSFSTSLTPNSSPIYSSQPTSKSPTSSLISSSISSYMSTSPTQKGQSSTLITMDSTVGPSSSLFSTTTVTSPTSTQSTPSSVSSSTTMSATPGMETSLSPTSTKLSSSSLATVLESSFATAATDEATKTTTTPALSTTSMLSTSPSSKSSSTVLSTTNDFSTTDTFLYTTTSLFLQPTPFAETDSTFDSTTTVKALPTSTSPTSSVELPYPTSSTSVHSYSIDDMGLTDHTLSSTITDVTDPSQPNLTSASDASTTTRYIEDLEERKKSEIIAEKLKELKNSRNESSDDIIDKMLGSNREELIELIQNEISTNPKIDNPSIREYIEKITTNMTSSNEELAKAIESILSDLEKVDIKSPNVMFDLLENVKESIAESNGFTIDPIQGNGEQYGTYFSEYGVLSGEDLNIVLYGCSVTIQGKDVFLSGRIIPSKIQAENEQTYLKYYPEGTVEMVAGFQNWTSVSVERGSFVSKKLTDSSSVIHFENAADIQIGSNEYNPAMVYGVELWNSSLLRVSGSKQSQNSASLTAFVNIENLQLNLQLTKSFIPDLLQGIPQSVIGCSFQITVQDETYTVAAGEGLIMAKNIDETTHTIVYMGSSMTVTPEFTELHKLFYFPFNFKNVDVIWFDNTGIGNTTIRLKAPNNDRLNIDVLLPESKLPPVQSRTNSINRTTLIINSPATIDEINVVLKNGGILTVTGAITIERTIMKVGNKSLTVNGKTFTISLEENNTLSLSDVVYELRRTTSNPSIVLLSALVTTTSIPHFRSEFVFDEDKMYFSGGTLIRNQTNGITLIGSTIQLSKDFSASSFNVIPQSLFTQKSYEYVTNTMSNINDYLNNNSYSLSSDQLTKALDEMLNTTSSLIDSLQTSAKSPLPSDVAINLLYEKTNYNDIFNVLPENPDDIRYVEEMTEDEWAADATKIVQKQMAKDLLEQTKRILNNLVDTIATKKIQDGEIPFVMEFPRAGIQMILAGGTSEFVLNNTYSCTNWQVGFPKNVEDLNIHGITKDTIIRIDVACYGSNNYYFVDDYDQLINSGSVDVQLKTADSKVLKVKDAKEPIVIVGESNNDNITPLIPLASNHIDENQILDFRSFVVSAWNTSLTLEVQFPTLANSEEKILFLGYQSQPGPRDEDHEYIFKYNSSIDHNRFFISSEKLYNMTGMFILGIGTKVCSTTNGTVTYDEVDRPAEISEPFQFKKDSSEFYARVLTKGCYAYNNETDRMESEGVSVIDTPSTTSVICHSIHLTSFSIGIKNPEMAVKYSYDFTVDIVPKNVQPIILIAAYTIFLLITFYNCCTVERLDKDRGEMRHLKDNHPADEYIYVISVFTGFRQFSSSQSTICFNITGEAASEMGRRLETEEDDVQHVLKWGTCARFLMRTHWPLGKLKYLRLWLEKPGEEQSEAWFCTKVIIYDVQTEKKFTFPVHSWFGRTNGDGQTERLCQVDRSINLFNESISFHNILEQISYIAMFLGGTGISRARLERDVYILSLWISSSIVTTILCFTTHLLNNSKTKDSYKVFDAVVGMILALLLTAINMILPYIAKKSYTIEENERVKYYMNSYINYVEAERQWKPLLKSLVATIMKTTIMILLVLNTVKCFSLSEQYANTFTRRFLVMMFLWIAIFEPTKAFLICLKNIKWNRTYQIITASELSFLPIKALTEFQKCPEEIVDKSTGSSYADLSKLRASKDNRMRDEMLFHTIREIIFLVFSLIIFVSLTYRLRDRFGYYYHYQIKNNYNLEIKDSSFSNIKSIDDFWKWSDSSLVNGLMASWPDRDPAYDMRGFVNDKASRTMGTGIIRQIRSVPHKCDFVLPEASSQSVCVDDIWNAGYEMTTQFDPSWLPYTNSTDTEYTYRSNELLQSNSIMGQLGTYKSGGYVVSLQGTADALRKKFEKLRNESWIDKETRAVVVELSLYNAQINYFGVLQLLLEIPKTKFCIPTVWVESMRLIREDEDTINETIECLYICYCVIKFALEFFYIIHDRFKLLGKHLIFNPILLFRWFLIGGYDLWQTMDFFVGLVSMISIITYIMKAVYVKEAVDSFLNTNGNSYINLSKQRDTDLMFTYTFATVVFFVSCKLMKILRFNHRIGVLADTLESATTGISDYGQGFLCVLNAFILAMMHLLGNSLEGYYSYIVSLQTLVSSLLGKLGGGKVYDVSTLGSTYFLLFMFLGTVLLLNVFVMIIMYEFEIVRTNADRLANNYEIIEHISYKVKNKCGMLERSNKVSVALQDQYCEAPLLQIFKRKIYLAIYRMNRLHNMNRLNRSTTREARIESVPDDIKNATAT